MTLCMLALLGIEITDDARAILTPLGIAMLLCVVPLAACLIWFAIEDRFLVKKHQERDDHQDSIAP